LRYVGEGLAAVGVVVLSRFEMMLKSLIDDSIDRRESAPP
jgi:hypothetical protein